MSGDDQEIEPSLSDVQREFPQWRCWRGISGMYHARPAGAPRGTGPEVRGEDPLDLRDQIIRAESIQE